MFEAADVTGSTASISPAKPGPSLEHPAEGGFPAADLAPGKSELAAEHQGAATPGSPFRAWRRFRSRAALQRLHDPQNPHRSRSPDAGPWSRGDILRCASRSTQADMTWWPVSDPLPAGARSWHGSAGFPPAHLERGAHKRYGRL